MNKSSNQRSTPAKGQRARAPGKGQRNPQGKRSNPNASNRGPRMAGEVRGIQAPTSIGSVQGASRPNVSSSSKDGDVRVRVRHREYITDISGSVAFAVAQYNVNPGLAATFPWLSGLAGLFESYKFNALKFQYRTESATSQVGKVLMTVDWDVLDSAPLSKQAMMQERTKADGPTWVDIDLRCDLPDLLKFGVQRYIRSSAAPSGTDLKTYDVGMFNIGSQGVTNAPVIGEIWVEYDVELITPNTAPSPPSGKIVAAGGSISNAQIFGAAPTVTGNMGVTASVNTLTFPSPGQYFVEYAFTGTLSAATFSTGSAAVEALGFPTGLVTNGTQALFSLGVQVTSANQTVIVSSPTGTVTALSVRIAPYTFSVD